MNRDNNGGCFHGLLSDNRCGSRTQLLSDPNRITGGFPVALMHRGLVLSLMLAMSVARAAGPESSEVVISGGLLTVNATDAPLETLMQEIADQAGFRLIGSSDEDVTASFDALSLEEGILQLLGDIPSVIFHSGQTIISVHILPRLEQDLKKGTSEAGDLVGPEELSKTTDMEALAAEVEQALPSWVDGIQATNEQFRATSELTDLIAYDGNPAVRRAAVINLGKRKAGEALPGLSKALSDEDKIVRLRSVVALGRIRSDEAIALLSQALLHDPNPTIRRMAAKRLGRTGHQQALTALRTAQTDSDDQVRKTVETALVRLGHL